MAPDYDALLNAARALRTAVDDARSCAESDNPAVAGRAADALRAARALCAAIDSNLATELAALDEHRSECATVRAAEPEA